MGYVDLHSHVLYGLDDGSPDAETSAAMLDGLAALGISEQCLTPHQKASQYLPAWDDVERTFAAIEAVRQPHHPTLRLGAENMWDDVFRQRATEQAHDPQHYRGTKAFLVEIPPPLMPPEHDRRAVQAPDGDRAWSPSSPIPSATTRSGRTRSSPSRSAACVRSRSISARSAASTASAR